MTDFDSASQPALPSGASPLGGAAHPSDLTVSNAWYSRIPLVFVVACVALLVREIAPLSGVISSHGRDTGSDVVSILLPAIVVALLVVLIFMRIPARNRTKALRARFPSAAVGTGIWAKATRSSVPEKQGGIQANSFGLVVDADGVGVWEDASGSPLVQFPRRDIVWLYTAVIPNGNRQSAGLVLSTRSRGEVPLVLTDPDRLTSSYLGSRRLNSLAVDGRRMLGLR